MTLAEFASKYKKSSNKTLDKSDEKKIQLQGGFGVMSQRGTPAIIRYHQWSEKKQPSQYYIPSYFCIVLGEMKRMIYVTVPMKKRIMQIKN